MTHARTILAAVNRDNLEGRVLAAARTLAAQLGAEVALLHVLELEPEYNALAEKEAFHVGITSWLQGLRDELIHDGVMVGPSVYRKGKAFLEIVAASEDVDADLIVLGARGAASPHLFQLGTTVEKVMRRAAKPVLVVHPERPLSFGNILCPVDFSSASARALTHAIGLARAFRGRLHVMAVLPLPMIDQHQDLRVSQWTAEAERAALPKCAERLQEFLGEFDLRGIECEQQIARGDPAQEIVAAAIVARLSMVVMASVGRTGLPHIHMGSVALKVARQLPCNLLVVTQQEAILDRLQQAIDDITAGYREGKDLLARGCHQEALASFERCLHLDPYFAPALDGKATAHNYLGHVDQAERCRQQAELLRRELNRWQTAKVSGTPQATETAGALAVS